MYLQIICFIQKILWKKVVFFFAIFQHNININQENAIKELSLLDIFHFGQTKKVLSKKGSKPLCFSYFL